MSLRKQIRSKVYMDEVFNQLSLGERPRYGRKEFGELAKEIDYNFFEGEYIGDIDTIETIEGVIASGGDGGYQPYTEYAASFDESQFSYATIGEVCVAMAYNNGGPNPLTSTLYVDNETGVCYSDGGFVPLNEGWIIYSQDDIIKVSFVTAEGVTNSVQTLATYCESNASFAVFLNAGNSYADIPAVCNTYDATTNGTLYKRPQDQIYYLDELCLTPIDEGYFVYYDADGSFAGYPNAYYIIQVDASGIGINQIEFGAECSLYTPVEAILNEAGLFAATGDVCSAPFIASYVYFAGDTVYKNPLATETYGSGFLVVNYDFGSGLDYWEIEIANGIYVIGSEKNFYGELCV